VESDSVDRIVQAWRASAPELDSSILQVTGRLLLCAGYYERAVIAILRPFGLSIADFDVLNTLRRVADERGSKPTDLARASLITTGAMTSRLDRLDRSGLISRTSDPGDRRGVLVRLSARGTEIATQALDAVIAGSEEFFAPVSAAQRESLASALRLLLLRHETPGLRR
jgi:DNA-binding MarR family transcriptional regulator